MSVVGQQETEKLHSGESLTGFSGGILPVFRGLDDVPVPQKEIAAILGVTAPTFSKWRSGRINVPDCDLVLLTLLLAHWIDEMEVARVRRGLRHEAKLKTIHRCLLQQETINLALPPQKVRDGSHRFREWWFREGEQSSITPRMAS